MGVLGFALMTPSGSSTTSRLEQSSWSSNTLGIMPVYLRNKKDAHLAWTAVKTFSETVPEGTELLLVDDGSPDQYLWQCLSQDANADYGVSWHSQLENKGFSSAVNVGLRKARDSGRNALLINSDIEFIQRGYIERMEARTEDVIGALLLYRNHLIQHAGIYFSPIRRQFDHIYRLAPADLPEAHRERVCPVTGALQFIRHSTLVKVGIYDENFRLGYEDVSYCHDVFESGGTCVYDPEIIAIHHESMTRGMDTSKKHEEWQAASLMYLYEKHKGLNFSKYVPTLHPELDA